MCKLHWNYLALLDRLGIGKRIPGILEYLKDVVHIIDEAPRRTYNTDSGGEAQKVTQT
jgi:hypothetical protein